VKVRFARKDDGTVAIYPDDDATALYDFLKDVPRRFLAEAADAAREEPEDDQRWGGDYTTAVVRQDDVLVVNEYTDEETVLSREEFVEVVEAYLSALDA
jgi:hypothetical protein